MEWEETIRWCCHDSGAQTWGARRQDSARAACAARTPGHHPRWRARTWAIGAAFATWGGWPSCGQCGRMCEYGMATCGPGCLEWTWGSWRHGQPQQHATVDSPLPLGVSPPSHTCFHDSHALSRFQPLPPSAIGAGCGLACAYLVCACAFARMLPTCSPCVALLVLGCQELFSAFPTCSCCACPGSSPIPSCCSYAASSHTHLAWNSAWGRHYHIQAVASHLLIASSLIFPRTHGFRSTTTPDVINRV